MIMIIAPIILFNNCVMQNVDGNDYSTILKQTEKINHEAGSQCIKTRYIESGAKYTQKI